MNPLFDRYLSLPATVARHQSAPLAIERERFLTHLEAGGTGQQAIRTAACYLLQFVRKKLRKPRTVGKKLSNQGSENTAGTEEFSALPRSSLLAWRACR